MGEVGDGEGGGCASMLMQKYEIRKAAALGASDKVRQDQVAAIQSDGCGQKESYLFREAGKTTTRVATSGDEHARVDDAGEVGVLVV